MLPALWTYAKARRRMIGRCPPHRYIGPTGTEHPFCLDCGQYKKHEAD